MVLFPCRPNEWPDRAHQRAQRGSPLWRRDRFDVDQAAWGQVAGRPPASHELSVARSPVEIPRCSLSSAMTSMLICRTTASLVRLSSPRARLAPRLAMLAIKGRVTPPLRPRPRHKHAAKQEVDGQRSDRRARIQRRAHHVDKVAVQGRVPLGKPAVDKDCSGRACEDDVGWAGKRVTVVSAACRSMHLGCNGAWAWLELGTWLMCLAGVVLSTPLWHLQFRNDNRSGADDGEVDPMELLVGPAAVRKPQRDGHGGTEGEPEVQCAVLAGKETARRDGTPDDTGRVEDLRATAGPLPCWVDRCAVQVVALGRDDRLKRNVWSGLEAPGGAAAGRSSQFVMAPRTVPRIWAANISRGGMEVYHPSLRSATSWRAWDMAM